MGGVLRSIPSADPIEPFPAILVASVGVCARAASSKETVSSVPAWFRADSGTNLFQQGEIVTG